NLLYVAVTRTRNILYIPQNLLPAGFSATRKIISVKTEEKNAPGYPNHESEKSFSNSRRKIQSREKPASANQPWTPELDGELRHMFDSGTEIEILATYFGRSPSAIRFRLKKLGLFEYFT